MPNQHETDCVKRNQPLSEEGWVGALSRDIQRQDDIASSKAQRIRPGVRESALYKVMLQQLQHAKKRHGQHKFTSTQIGRSVKYHPLFREVNYRQVGPVIKALEADGVIKRVPPDKGRKGSNTFVFS